MIGNLSLKDKKALIIGGICVGIYLIGIWVAKPIYLKQRGPE